MMYIFKEQESSNYWQEGSQQNIKLESSCINGNITARNNNDSPTDVLHSQQDVCCKTENHLYQYCDRNFNFTALANANGAGGVISEDDDYNAYPHKRKFTAVTRR